MLNVMRKHAGSWMIKVLLFAIVIVFVFWGVGSFRSRRASKVATVNGEIISIADYRRVYNNMVDQYRQRFGEALNDGMIEMLQIKKQALDQLIDRTILLQEAKKLGLRVTETEVADSIMKTEIFHSNGAFDSRRYRSILSQVHLTPEEFEADQKNVLLGQKLTRIIMGAAKVSDAEAHQWYDWQKKEVSVDYVLFAPDRYKDIKPSEKEVADYFAKEKEKYKTEPKVKARYVVFDPETFTSRVVVNDEDIASYYESNLSQFSTEKTVEARHILIRVDPKEGEEADQAAKAKAQEVATFAKSGQDFAELAKKYSEGPTKDRGGYLGKFTKTQMVAPFADKAFSLAPGEISEPVKTQFGWHVIKVESVEEASVKTLDESKGEITRLIQERDARNLAYDEAEEFYERCFEKEDLVKNAKAIGRNVMETEAFGRKGPDLLGRHGKNFANTAFALDVDEISDIQEIDGRYYIIQMTEKIPSSVPSLEAVQSRVEADLTKNMQDERAKSDAESMAADLSEEKGFEEIAKQHDTVVKESGLFMRNSSIPEIGSDTNFSQAAFQLASVGNQTTQSVKGNAGYYLMRLSEIKTADNEGFDSEKEGIKKRLLGEKQRRVMQDWIDARKATSQIKKEHEYID